MHPRSWLAGINRNPARDYRIASGGGRMVITMDRYGANWDMVRKGWDTYVSDALLASSWAHWLGDGGKPVIGGFSAGANNALATVNRAPHRFSGLFMYEGAFYSEDPAVIEHNEGACAQLGLMQAEADVYWTRTKA